jgi:hypothetical protein
MILFGCAVTVLPLACSARDSTSGFGNHASAGGAAPATGGVISDGSGGATMTPGSGGASSALGTGGVAHPTPSAPSAGGGIMMIPSAETGGASSGVSFDWPESDGGKAQNCKAGHYVGTFSCTYQFAMTDGGGIPITGPVELTLSQSQDGEFLEVSGGTLDGHALIAIHFTADIHGKLDCSTGVFQGTLENGSYAVDPFPSGGTFNGPLTASTTMTPPCSGTCLNGTWALHETGAAGTNHIGTCAGTWTAALQP